MAIPRSLIKKKSNRLEDVPKEFLKSVEKYQKKLFINILALLNNVTRDAEGKIIFSSEDLSNLNAIKAIQDEIKNFILGSDYVNYVDSFAQEFDAQALLSNKYFSDVFPTFTRSAAADAVLAASKESAVTALIGEPLDTNFLLPIKSLLENSVESNASWTDTVQSIRDFVEGTEDADGRLLHYSKQIATDSFSISDRSYTNVIAEEVEAEWYFYSGNEILSTRCFCEERIGKYFHYRFIESWGNGQNLGGCNEGDGTWHGMRDGTNSQTIFIFAGGYNCQHSINPVSIFDVPIGAIQDAISAGYFEPSEKEIELLGL